MKTLIILSGHIRNHILLEKNYNELISNNPSYDFDIMFCTSKHNYNQVNKNPNLRNNIKFEKIDDEIDEDYIKSLYTNDVSFVYDDEPQYCELYQDLMHRLKVRIESLDINAFPKLYPTKLRTFLETFEIELNQTYHTHSFIARCVDEIAKFIFAIKRIKKKYDMVIITRPDMYFINCNLNDILRNRKGKDFIWSCDGDYDNYPFITPGFIIGSPYYIKKIYDTDFLT
jgi:hypothetical protein